MKFFIKLALLFAAQMLYLYNLASNQSPEILESLEFVSDSVTLDASKMKEFLTEVARYPCYESDVLCFIPHYGIIFYNEQKEIVADVSICLLCSKYKAHGLLNMGIDLDKAASYFRSIGFPVFSSAEEYRHYAGAKGK